MTTDRGPTLLALARGAIAREFLRAEPAYDPAEWLQEPGSTFVTLRIEGELRGCVGSLWAMRRLGEDVAANAQAAAFRDSRFPPLIAGEYPRLHISVSLLAPMEPLEIESEAHLLAELRPGVDGLVLQYRRWRGVFLPDVWEQLPKPRVFLDHLLEKAGLPASFWAEGIVFHRFTSTRWQEAEAIASTRGAP